MTKQKGFTLIELMIVVAIIGILAAVAIPAYSDYMTKSKVGEASVLVSGIKTCIDTFFQEESRVPKDDDTAGGEYKEICAPKTAGKYVSDIQYLTGTGNAASLTATLLGGGTGQFGGTGKIQWLFVPADKEWVCSATDTANATDVDPKYLPKACR